MAIIGRLVEDMESDGKRERPIRPLVEAQILELQRRYTDYVSSSADLVPGDLVVERDGMGVLTNEARKDVVLILWRTLDEHDWQDRELIKDWIAEHEVNRLDCILAYVDADGGGLTFMLHELARLRKRDESDCRGGEGGNTEMSVAANGTD